MNKSRIPVIFTLMMLTLSFVSADLVIAATPDGMPDGMPVLKKVRPRRPRRIRPVPPRNTNVNNGTANNNTPVASSTAPAPPPRREGRNIFVRTGEMAASGVKKGIKEIKGIILSQGRQGGGGNALREPPPRRPRI